MHDDSNSILGVDSSLPSWSPGLSGSPHYALSGSFYGLHQAFSSSYTKLEQELIETQERRSAGMDRKLVLG